MYLTDLARHRDIGANCLLLEIGSYRILVDAGIHPKNTGWAATPNFQQLEPNSLDFIILTHCHLDHIGVLPLVAQQHPKAIVLTTVPSQLIAGRILVNSLNVMKRQRDELDIPEYPLYTATAIGELERRFLPMAYGKTKYFDHKNERLAITFHSSGHVPGAAGISFKTAEESIFMTGDVLFEEQLTLPAARFPDEHFDVLIMETTRGATERLASRTRESEYQRLLDMLIDTLHMGGSCLIPAFAFGRMQEIIALLHTAFKEQILPDFPIFCSGLGMALVEYFDHISRRTGLVRFREKMIRDLKIRTLSEPLVPGRAPKKQGIYILSSGMLVENTPSYMAAAALAADPRSAFLFVGYCDEETPGGILLNTLPGNNFHFEALGYTAPLKARVERFDLSGHADRNELIEFAQCVTPKTIFLTHGDGPARDWFLNTLPIVLPETKVIDPIVGVRTASC